MRRIGIFLFLLTAILNTLMSHEIPVYIASNASDNEKPILRCRLDTESGDLTKMENYGGVVSPSYLCFSPDGSYLYTTLEAAEGRVSSWQVDPGNGKLSLTGIGETGGSGPCHLSVTSDGSSLLVANYNSGQISVLPIGSDGRIQSASQLITLEGSGPDKSRQESSHMHFIRTLPGTDLVMAVDLGSDKIMLYRYEASSKRLISNTPDAEFKVKPGSGPRHIAFYPSGDAIYLLNELAATVDAISLDSKTGRMALIGSYSLLPEGFGGYNKSAAIRMHPSGKFVYGSNRGDLDRIAVFRVLEDESLEFVGLQSEGIHWPRDFNIDPSGKLVLVANRSTDEVRVFAIDQGTGMLTDTGKSIPMEKPVCVLFGDVL